MQKSTMQEALERARKKKQGQPVPPLANPVPPAACKPPVPLPADLNSLRRKGQPPVIGSEPVVAVCSHVVMMPLFDPSKDRYRDGRRQNILSKPCPQCRQKAHQDRMARDAEAKAKRKNDAPKRLPDGSAFLGKGGVGGPTWDATANRWFVSLQVPGYPLYEANGSALFRVLIALDKMYRKDEKSKLAETNNEAGQG